MSDKAGIETIVSGVTDKLEAMIQRANTLPQFFERNVSRKYLTAQKERWMTENSSGYTTGGWKALDPKYAEAKLHRYKNYEGGGRKMLIATNRLVNSILAKSGEYKQAVGEKSMVISTTVGYATYVNEKRTFTEFSPKFYQEIGTDLLAYLGEGKL